MTSQKQQTKKQQPGLIAGAAAVEITPDDSQFLYGYPHVKRYSTGTHDPLFSSALYLSNGDGEAMFIANDIIFISKNTARRVRETIAARTGMLPENIMVTATHTHSGPIALDYKGCRNDPAVPGHDPKYVFKIEEAMISAGEAAWRSRREAEAGTGIADGSCTGTNRRDPKGPANPNVPVMLVRERNGNPIACMLVCSMHPTVLHEDSTLVSADFPGMTRQALQRDVLGAECPVLHHTGPAGNQSPRHITKSNTFEEAERIGGLLAEQVKKVLNGMKMSSDWDISCRRVFREMKRRQFPSVAESEEKLKRALDRFQTLKNNNAPRQETRTAECDWFGAEGTLDMAKAAETGILDIVSRNCTPAEIQLIAAGPMAFIGWPGECFVEYSLDVIKEFPNASIIAYANGELKGYIVTPEAAAEGGYEASVAMFSHQNGPIMVEAARELLS